MEPFIEFFHFPDIQFTRRAIRPRQAYPVAATVRSSSAKLCAISFPCASAFSLRATVATNTSHLFVFQQVDQLAQPAIVAAAG
jgi:hypothetical protein